MYNDFVIVGPKSDPAKIAGGKDVLEALKKIEAAKAPFVSRGDKSGTHAAELRYWKSAGVDIAGQKGPWYKETGSGMGPALNTASSMNAYILTDRGTWLAFKNRGDLAILVEGDQKLFNQYGVMLVNPAKHAHVKKDLGDAFVNWVVSPAGQKAIADYKIGGEQLFFPNYKGADARHPRSPRGDDAQAALAQEPVRLYAAGSLRAALNEVAAAFTAATSVKVVAEYGPSGLLRDRIAKGEPAEVFASANMAHPESLAKAGKAAPVVLFARNRLCALAAPATNVTSATLLDRMLDPAVKLGTSTPKADPSGDYAWELFDRAERLRPGAAKTLSAKALQLTGGPDSPPPPKDRNVYGQLVSSGQADLFLTYCTNALQAKSEVAALQIVAIPEPLAVGADYGLTVIGGARPDAERFAQFVLSAPGQAILVRHGFAGATEARTPDEAQRTQPARGHGHRGEPRPDDRPRQDRHRRGQRHHRVDHRRSGRRPRAQAGRQGDGDHQGVRGDRRQVDAIRAIASRVPRRRRRARARTVARAGAGDTDGHG